MRTRSESTRQQRSGAFQVDQTEIGYALAQAVAIGSLQRRTSHDHGRQRERVGDCIEPWSAISIVQGDARGHLMLVARGVKIVAVDERPMQSRRAHHLSSMMRLPEV